MRISILRENLVNRYKAKFTPNPKGKGYVFYATESSNGYECSEQQAQEYIDSYARTLKKYSRIMIVWIILAAIAMGMIQGFKIYVFSKFEMVLYFIIPLPIVVARVMRVYNAPKALERGKQISGIRDQKAIAKARIKSMNPSMLYVTLGVSIIGICSTILNDEFQNKLLYILIFSGLIAFAMYMLWQQRKIANEEVEILDQQKINASDIGMQYVTEDFFDQNEPFFFEKITQLMSKRKRANFWEKVTGLERSYVRVFEVLNERGVTGHTSYMVDWKDAETMLFMIGKINKTLELEEFKPSNVASTNDHILEEYHMWLLKKGYCLWQIDHGADFYAGFVVKIFDIQL